MIKQPRVCRECGSTDLQWDSAVEVRPGTGVANGRLVLSDVKATFFLSCNRCSETLLLMTCEEVVDILNILRTDHPQERSEG